MTDLVAQLVGALELCYDHCRLWHPDVEKNNVGESVRAAISAAKTGRWVAVPVEPTPKMVECGRWSEYDESSIRLSPVDDETVRAVWDSMIAARPLPNPPKEQA